MQYKQKVDVWIKIILIASTFILVPFMFFVPEDEILYLFIPTIILAIIDLPFLYGYVELNDEYLLVRVGFVKSKIYYEDIKSVKLVTNFLSSMAMTKDRIEIKKHNKNFFTGTIHIGPEEREEVYYELLRRCPNLKD